MNERMQREAARRLALRIIDTIRHLLRDEEVQDALQEWTAIAKEELADYLLAETRLQQRLNPMGAPKQ